jgi:hypothetical protein
MGQSRPPASIGEVDANFGDASYAMAADGYNGGERSFDPFCAVYDLNDNWQVIAQLNPTGGAHSSMRAPTLDRACHRDAAEMITSHDIHDRLYYRFATDTMALVRQDAH